MVMGGRLTWFFLNDGHGHGGRLTSPTGHGHGGRLTPLTGHDQWGGLTPPNHDQLASTTEDTMVTLGLVQ